MTKVSRLIREPDVLARVPFSRPTLHRKVRDGSFPSPVKIGVRARAWLAEEIDSWEQSLIEERNAERESHRAPDGRPSGEQLESDTKDPAVTAAPAPRRLGRPRKIATVAA